MSAVKSRPVAATANEKTRKMVVSRSSSTAELQIFTIKLIVTPREPSLAPESSANPTRQ